MPTRSFQQVQEEWSQLCEELRSKQDVWIEAAGRLRLTSARDEGPSTTDLDAEEQAHDQLKDVERRMDEFRDQYIRPSSAAGR